MSLMPRAAINSLATVAGASRYPAGVPVAPVDPTPATEIDQRRALTNDDQPFSYERLVGGQDRRAQGDRRMSAPPTAFRPRALFAGLLAESTASFVEAFGARERQTTGHTAANHPPLANVTYSINSYELADRVIHDQLPELGTNLTLTL